jgi:hypothetical protein
MIMVEKVHKKCSTSRTPGLLCAAALLCSYLACLHWKTNLPLVPVIAAVALYAVIQAIRCAIRGPRLSMRMLVIVLPIFVGLLSLTVREFSNGRKQKETLTRANAGANMHFDGIRGSAQNYMWSEWGNAYYGLIALDIRDLMFHPGTVKCDELRKLSLNRLEEVTMQGFGPGIANSTVEWLNELPHSVKLKLITLNLPLEDTLALSRLTRPLDELSLRVRTFGTVWNQDEFAAALAIPARHLAIIHLKVDDPSTITTKVSPAESLVVSGLPSQHSIALARLKKCTRLELAVDELSIEECENLRDLPHLRELKISGPVYKDHLRVLLEARQLRSLSTAVFHITDSEIQTLQDNKRPGLELSLFKRRAK